MRYIILLLVALSHEAMGACYTSVPANETSVDASRTMTDGVTNTYFVNNFGALVLYQKSGNNSSRYELTLKVGGDCNLSQVEAIHTEVGNEEVLALDQKGQVQHYGWRSAKGWAIAMANVSGMTLPKFVQLQTLVETEKGFALKILYQDGRRQKEGILSFDYTSGKWSFAGK